MPGFAGIAKPLFDLTKEKTLFIWTTAHQTELLNHRKRMPRPHLGGKKISTIHLGMPDQDRN
jgi:hypothetical protein